MIPTAYAPNVAPHVSCVRYGNFTNFAIASRTMSSGMFLCSICLTANASAVLSTAVRGVSRA